MAMTEDVKIWQEIKVIIQYIGTAIVIKNISHFTSGSSFYYLQGWYKPYRGAAVVQGEEVEGGAG